MRHLKLTLKIMLATAGVAVLLAAAVIGTVQYLLPSDRIKPIILDYAGRYIDRRIEIDDVRINLLTGITLLDVRIGDAPGLDEPFITAAELSLGYRLLPLLQKKIEISSVHLQAPCVRLTLLPDSSWNFASLLRTVPSSAAAADPADTAAAGMPFMLNVNSLKITDATLLFDAGIRGHLRGINLQVEAGLDTALVPRGTVRLTSTPGAAPHILAILPPGPETPGRSVRSGLALDLTVRMEGFDAVSIRGGAALESLIVHAPGIPAAPVSAGAELDLDANLTQGTLGIPALALSLNGHRCLRLDGSLAGMHTAPAGTVRITGGSLPLTALNAYLPAVLPGLTLAGTAALAGTRITFAADSSLQTFSGTVAPALTLSGFNGRYRTIPVTCGMAQFSVSGTGTGMYNTGNESGRARMNASMRISGLTVALPDARPVTLNEIRLDAGIRTGPDMLPEHLSASLSVNGPGTARFTTADTVSIRSLPYDADLKGTWELTGLDLVDLPVSLPATGIISMRGTVAGSSYSRIVLATDVEATDIAVMLDGRNTTFPPLRLKAGLTAGFTDDTFTGIHLSGLDVTLNDLLSITAAATVESSGAGGFTADLDNMQLNLDRLHDYLPPWLPGRVPTLAGMHLGGMLNVSGALAGALDSIPAPAGYLAMIRGTITARLDELQCTLPELNAGFERLNAIVEIGLAPDGMTLSADAAVNGVRVPDVLPEALESVSAQLTVKTADFNDAVIEGLTATVPSMGARFSVSGTVHTALTTPEVELDITAGVSTDTLLSPYPGISYSGDAEITLAVGASANPEDTVSVSGAVSFTSFGITMAPDLSVNRINGRLPFRQALIPALPQLLPSPRREPVTTGLDYLEFTEQRSLYLKTLTGLGSLSIGSISYGPYHIGDLSMDLRYRDNRLDIRRISINDLYNGNLAGALQCDLGDGRPAELLRTISYGMVFQLAEIDADSLVLSIPMLRAVHTGGLGKTDEAKLGADFTFHGTGLDLADVPELNGAMNFSKIGRRVASDLLYILDPEGKDRSINQTRFLLNRGARPAYMQFTVRQNLLYTSIFLDMPPYIRWNPLINIPQPIEYARKPIITAIKNLGVL